MKKIINGRLYNTETAELIASHDNGYFANDFHYCSEDLYRKKNGEFFLYGEGGGLSKYAEPYGNGWGYGEIITPLSVDEAKKWMEKRGFGHDCG